MAKIVCPNCGEVIDVDPSAVEDLTRQLRDELFDRDLEARLAEAGHLHAAQVETARMEERQEADRRVSEAQAESAELRRRFDAAEGEWKLTLQEERSESAERISQLKAQLAAADQRIEIEVGRAQAQARDEIAQLRAQLDTATRETELSVQRTRAQDEVELLRATAQLEQRSSELEAQLKVVQANSEKAQADLREEHARREAELVQRSEERLEAKNAQIKQYEDEVNRLRDYRMRLSTKLIGESLERHCESEFNRIRMQAYPRATFEKDNEAVEGTKGDFIFRDYDDEGNELLSIMFEMKNEEETSSTVNRKRNEDHFKKLDGDRTKKHCEYAVLVSTLEPDNDFYNAGIADVSWQYPKMFVVRPQCFTTIIGLLKAAALAAHPYRLQLERVKREELDVTRFEEKVTTIVDGIANDYQLASKNYAQAEKDIDAIILKLQHLKGQLGTAAKHFGTAAKRGEKLSVKRLTWGNQTMKAVFAEAHEAREAPEGAGDSPADLLLAPDSVE